MKKSLFFLAFLSFASIHTAESNQTRFMLDITIPDGEKVLVIMTVDTNPSTHTFTRTFTVEPFNQEKFNSCRLYLSFMDAPVEILQAIADYCKSKEFNAKS